MATFRDAMKNSVADTMELRPEQLHPEWFDENGGFIKDPMPDYKITLPDGLKPDVPRKVGPDFISEPDVPSGIIGPDGRPRDLDPGINGPIKDHPIINDPGFKIDGPSRGPIFNDPGFKIEGPSKDQPIFEDPGFKIGEPIKNDSGLNGPGFGDKGEPINAQPAGINPDNLKDVLEKAEARRKALENAEHIPDSQAREAYKKSIIERDFNDSAKAVKDPEFESRYDLNPRNPENQLKDVEIDQTVHADLHAEFAEAVETKIIGRNHREVKTLEYKEPVDTLPIVNKPEMPSGMIGRDGKPVEVKRPATAAEERAKIAETFLGSDNISARGAEHSAQVGE